MSHTNPISPEVISEAQALLAFAMSIPREVADIFIDFSPHVTGIDVRINLGGWSSNAPKDLNECVYLSKETSLADIKTLRQKVEDCISNWKALPPIDRKNQKAEALREAAKKLLAEAESLTAPTA